MPPWQRRRAPPQASAGVWTWQRSGQAAESAWVCIGCTARTLSTSTECLVLNPALVALIAPLRVLVARLRALRREGSIIANLLDSGPDVLLRTDAMLELADRIALTEFARAHRLPRVAWAQGNDEPEPVAVLRPPTTSLSGISITPPPGAFLQASASGEAAIIAAVLDALPAKGRVAELFAGCGTITFALARRARVTAWEGDPASVSALREPPPITAAYRAASR